MAVASAVMVGMAELRVLRGAGELTCLGLGSCIGLCGLDPISGVGGAVHVMLPEAFADKPLERPGKFADTGVPALIEEMERAGAVRARVRFVMAGGAQVFKFGDGSGPRLDIGARNIAAVQQQVQRLGLNLLGSDVGGNLGRTVVFVVETGVVRVRTVSQSERILGNLRS